MKELSDWSLWVREGCEECWVEMDQGPSESGLHPNTALPFGEHSSRAHICDRKKDTNLASQETGRPCSASSPSETLDTNTNASYTLSIYSAAGSVC